MTYEVPIPFVFIELCPATIYNGNSMLINFYYEGLDTRDGTVVGVLRSEDLFREVCTLTVTDNAPVFTMDSGLSGKSKVGYIKLTTSL